MTTIDSYFEIRRKADYWTLEYRYGWDLHHDPGRESRGIGRSDWGQGKRSRFHVATAFESIDHAKQCAQECTSTCLEWRLANIGRAEPGWVAEAVILPFLAADWGIDA